MDWTAGLWLFLVSFGAATLAIFVVSAFAQRKTARTSVFDDRGVGAIFLFDNETMVDASADARALLASMPVRGRAWDKLLAFVAPRFPDFEARITKLPEVGRISIGSTGPSPMTLIAEWRGGLRRITLVDPHTEGQAHLVDSLSLRAQQAEVDSLRQTTDSAPFPIWRETPDGNVVWANVAYLNLVARLDGGDGTLSWPLPKLFPPDTEERRLRLELDGGDAVLWFDRLFYPAGTERILFALPADTAVQAETALREFVQTLTKTFAHLPTALAIFDRQRRLQLFNPALTDLSNLPVDFLSGRPTLFGFLDAMRERRMIPEPKNYKSWRQQMATLERSAAAGVYEETWSLPNGLTYRVTGRPHPEGALALMIEDISDEVTRTRNFRADLELGQTVIDAMDEAIAVFRRQGFW
jgi:PAS domain-containing protein